MDMKKKMAVCAVLFILGGVSLMSFGQDDASTPIVSENIGVRINGEDFNGIISPIIYGGSAYLPVRLLAKELGIAIYWKEDESTIEIGEKERNVDVTVYDYEDRFYSEYTTDEDLLKINGENGEYGIVFRKDFGDRYSEAGGYFNYAAIVKPNSAYQKFGGTIAMENNTNADEVLFKFYDNYAEDKLIKEVAVKRGENVDFEIDIADVQNVYIYQKSEDRVEKYSDPVKIVILEPYFK